MNSNTRVSSFLLFLVGLFGVTEIRVVGNIAISELVVFVSAPFVFAGNYALLKKDGFFPIICLSFATMVGCVISSLYNHIQLPFFVRGFANVYSIFSFLVVYHRLLRDNLKGLRWALLGYAISSVISIFQFQTGMDIDGMVRGQEIGMTASEAVANSALFGVGMINNWALLPIRGWYFSCPTWFSVWAPLVCGIIFIFITESGRSAALGTVGASVLALYCGKRESKMQAIGRHFLQWMIIAGVIMLLSKIGYSYLARNGILGEKQYQKYIYQTRAGSSIMDMLRSGRAEFFIGLTAALDKPLIGHGPWALDNKGYTSDYMARYALPEDYDQYLKAKAYNPSYVRLIPAHSQIVGFWVSFGIMGLILWGYILYLYCSVFKKGLSSIPQWFGFFALGIPAAIWHCLFSPFGARGSRVLLIACIIIARAVAKGRIVLSNEMQYEVVKNDR